MSQELRNIAYVNAQVACALIEMESMKAKNQWRKHQQESPAYGEEAFLAVINKYGIHHNAVLEVMR